MQVFPEQYIWQLDGDGDWLVWTDFFTSDIYAYNHAAGDGFYVTSDTAYQQKPKVSGSVIVWEDKRMGPSDILAYFIETGETRRLSRGGDTRTNHQNPSIHGTWVAWEDDRGEDFAIYAYDVQTNQELRVSGTVQSRDTDPVVIGNYVVFRTYRFNVWDLVWFDLVTGESGSVTSDRWMEQPPFRAGDRILFLKESEKGWLLHSWDPVTKITRNLDIYLQTPTEPAADGDALVSISYDGPRASFVARNLTNKASTRISGYLPIMDTPVLLGRTLHVPVFNGTNGAIVSLDVNPFALLRPPTLLVETPEDGTIVKNGQVRVSGTLTYEESWGEPDFFVYSVNKANWTNIFPSPKWAFTLDLRGARPGGYEVAVHAYYKEGPPVVKRFTVAQPAAFRGTDIEEAGREFAAIRLYGLYYRYVESNPAIVALAVLALVVVGLWFTKHRLTSTPRRRAVIEYVRQDD